MLNIITGSARADISMEIVRDMVSRSVAAPDKKYIIIVPEQFTLQTQKRVVDVHPSHACMNIDIVSFDRLAHVVLAKLGKDVSRILDDVGKALILKNVLNEIADDLNVYGNKIHLPGFLEEIKSLVTEFKQYRIDDNELFLMEEEAREKGALLAAKISDIRLIYRKFNEEIADKYTTSEEVLDVFARMLPQSDFIKDAEIYLDGFTGFTPIQLRLIEELLKGSLSVSCSVTIPEGEIKSSWQEYELFAFANDTLEKLKLTARKAGSEYEIRIQKDNAWENPAVDVVSCPSPLEEVEYVAGQILETVRVNGTRFRDIAVLSADIEGYYPIVRSVFDKAGISAFIDHKAEFSDNALVRFILAALECADRGLTYDNVFNALKCGITDLSLDECNILENYCLEFNIRGRSKWEGVFTANRQLRKDSDEYAFNLDEMNEYKKAVKPLIKFCGLASSGKKRKVSLYCKALEILLQESAAREKVMELSEHFKQHGNLAVAKQYEQIHEDVSELISKINLLLGDDVVSIREFRNVIEGGINELKIGIIPPSMDALVVGDLTRTRVDSVSHLFVIGVNDGLIPGGGSGSALFTQREREFLRKGHEIAPTVQENIYIQRYYLYLAFNKPEKVLGITYAGTSMAGEALEPSCILEDLNEYVGEADIKRSSYTISGDLWKDKVEELLCAEIKQLRNDNKRPDESSLLFFEYFAKENPQVIRKIANSVCFTNRQTPLDLQTALDLYGGVLKGSVSRYETFYNCPYRHFLNYGLGIEARREYEIQTTDLGTIYHDSLEKYSKKIEEKGFNYRTIDDENSHEIIAECVEEAIAGIGNDVLSSSSRNEYLKKRIAQITTKTTDVLREHVKSGLFEPAEFEYPFNEAISDDVVFKGKIDRIDIYDAGDVFVKIIDYKSGNKAFSISDIYNGVQLQLVAYVDSAVKAVKKKYPDKNVRPGGIYYYLINDRYELEKEAENKNRMSGLTLSEFDVIQAIDGELGKNGKKKSNIIPVTLTSNGIDSRSLAASEDNFNAMIRFVNRKIIDAGERIKSGDISLAPLAGDNYHNGCAFCDYKEICKFEPGCFGTDWVESGLKNSEMGDVVYDRN